MRGGEPRGGEQGEERVTDRRRLRQGEWRGGREHSTRLLG